MASDAPRALGGEQHSALCLSEVCAPAHSTPLGGGESGSVNSLSHRRCQETGFVIPGTWQGPCAILGESSSCSEEQLTEQFVISTLAA